MTTSIPLNSRISSRIASHKSSTQPVAYRFQRNHPALQVGNVLTVQSKREEPVRVFFGQNALDSACGLNVATMILVILDLAKSGALLDMNRRKFGVPAIVFAAFKHTVFEGVNADEYVTILESLDLPLQMTLRTEKDKSKTGSIDAFAVDCLMRGELVAIAIASVNNRRTKHWVLGIGVEGAMCGRDSIPDGMQLLDPSASAPPLFSACNARLRIPNDGRNSTINKSAEKLHKKTANLKPIHWTYESSDWNSEPVQITAAVRFRLKK
jgi:hypothetical protein